MAEVRISPKFFRNAFNDYQDDAWAFVREIMQNSLDADASEIRVDVREEGGLTRITVRDNGCGMTRDVLERKLLTLGESGKEFSGGAVGGFGKAKEILYFAQTRYAIHTGCLLVEGSGGSYEIRDDVEYRQGTTSDVWWGGDKPPQEVASAFRKFISVSDRPGVRLFLNGEEVKCKLTGTGLRVLPGVGEVRLAKEPRNCLVVRMRGMAMHTRYLGCNGRCVIVELGQPGYLTANRDGLVYNAGYTLQSLIDEVTINKTSALRKPPVTTYQEFGGQMVVVQAALGDTLEEMAPNAPRTPAGEPIPTSVLADLARQWVTTGPKQIVSSRSHEGRDGLWFVLKNTTGMRTPEYLTPPHFGHYGRVLLEMWVGSLVATHRMMGVSAQFKVGFILAGDREAEHDDEIYLINPVTVVYQKNSASRSLKKRFRLTEWYKVAALAVHEVCHGLGYPGHDENYASKLTDMFAVALANVKKFKGGDY